MTTHVERRDDGPAASRDLALATWALFVGLALMMVGAGLFGTLLGVRSETEGLSTALSSAISAAYYVGFLAGSRLTLAALGRVGHIRVYTALSSTLAAAMIGVGLIGAPIGWLALRFVTGLAIAGLYVVVESWLNDLASNENRGRLLAVYNVIATGCWGLGQLMISRFDARLVTGYAIATVLTCLAVSPVALSESSAPPPIAEREHISLRDLAKVVPTGVGSCVLVGMAHGALGGMSAIYATRVGLSIGQTALFVTAPMIGGMLFQWPIAAASDDVDRRAVGGAAATAAVLAAVLLLLGPPDAPMALVLIGLLGGASYPLYSIAAAYTNDWVDPEHVNAAASQLITLYGIGAIAGPFAAAGLMVAIGPEGYYWTLIIVHGLLAAFFGYRMRVWRSPLNKRPWNETSLPARAFFVPATVISLTRRSRRADSNSTGPP